MQVHTDMIFKDQKSDLHCTSVCNNPYQNSTNLSKWRAKLFEIFFFYKEKITKGDCNSFARPRQNCHNPTLNQTQLNTNKNLDKRCYFFQDQKSKLGHFFICSLIKILKLKVPFWPSLDLRGLISVKIGISELLSQGP